MIYKLLPKELRKKGIYYKQVFRDKDYAIYGLGNSKNSFLGYEVFQIPRHDGYEIAGNKIAPTEYIPKDEHFGISAFHCLTLERAKLRLQSLMDIKKLKDDAKLN
jgi:hypothetical protein